MLTEEPIGLVGLDYYGTVALISPGERSAAFDQIGRDAGLDLPDGTLFRNWLRLDRAPWPFDGPLPPFLTMRATWTELGNQLLARFGVRNGGAIVAHRNADLHASARPTAQVAAHLRRLSLRYPLVLLSDADAEFLLPSLERSGLRLAYVLYSESLRNYKPHAEMFRAMARRIGMPPHRVLHVGDDVRADILGARNAGMHTAWINTTSGRWPSSLPPPDVELRDITDLDLSRCQPRRDDNGLA